MTETEKKLIRLKHHAEQEVELLKQERDLIEQDLEDHYFLLDYVKNELDKK